MDFYFRGSGRSNLQFFYLVHILCYSSCMHQYECMSVTMFLIAFGVQEMADGRIQVAKQCQDRFPRLLIFAVWGSFANVVKICTPRK